MRRSKTPVSIEQNTWLRYEDYLIPEPEEGLWASGIKGEDPQETYETNLASADSCIRPRGKAQAYDLNVSAEHDQMLDSFLEIPKQPTIESKMQAIKEWLCAYGFPVKPHGGRITLNEVYDAACSTVWLKVINELVWADRKHQSLLKRELYQLMVVKDRSVLTEVALTRGEFDTYTHLFEKGTKTFSHKQALEWQYLLHKIEAFSMENIWIYFVPDGNWPGIFTWDRDNEMHPIWLSSARAASVYHKSDFTKNNINDLCYAAGNYLRQSLELILEGTPPSMQWRQDATTKTWIMVPCLKPTSPWQALNYALYRRVVNPHNNYKMCAYPPCGNMFKALRSTKRFCSDLCRVKNNQSTK